MFVGSVANSRGGTFNDTLCEIDSVVVDFNFFRCPLVEGWEGRNVFEEREGLWRWERVNVSCTSESKELWVVN